MCQTTTLMTGLPFKGFPLQTIAVSGNSMNPTFNDGDWLLFSPIKNLGSRQLPSLVGKVVVIERESYPGIHLIKRVTQVVDGCLWVEGDNLDQSSDSRKWGAINPSEVVGKVRLRYKSARR
jgi:nickel-type superoxide dismutase maturation protease